MRIFVAGATGVIGTPLVSLLVDAGHLVAGMTRTPAKAAVLQDRGAVPVVADVYDAPRLKSALMDFGPDVVIDLLTDLPDDPRLIQSMGHANARIRTAGTDSLLAAYRETNASHLLVESVAWELPGAAGEAVAYMEEAALAAGGVVVRYGQFYGPGTYHEDVPPSDPRIQIEEAARITAGLLDEPTGIIEVVEHPDDR